MKLNPECLRAFLLAIEPLTNGRTTEGFLFEEFTDTEEYPLLSGFPLEEIEYHARQCASHGYFINCTFPDSGCQIWLTDISPDGHAFIANIRDPKTWQKTLSAIAKKVGSASIYFIQMTAAKVIAGELFTS